jgi:hypothetical protein
LLPCFVFSISAITRRCSILGSRQGRTFVFDGQETTKLRHRVLRDIQGSVGQMLQLVMEPQQRLE